MKQTAPFGNTISVFGTTPCRGLSLSRLDDFTIGNAATVERRNAMSPRTMAAVALIALSTWQAASAQSAKETNTPIRSQANPRMHARAKAKITVQSSEAEPYDQTARPTLIMINLNETFTGDIDGESPVRALQALRDDK